MNSKNESKNSKIDNRNFTKTIHDSGLTVLSEQAPDSRSFAIGFAVNAGSQNDPKGFEGIAHFFEHIAFRRTKNRTGKRIADEFETMGAYINAYTTKELTFFYVRALNEHFRKCLNLLSEVVFHPALNDKDISRECSIILEEIASFDDDAEELIFDIGEEMAFNGTRLEHPIAGKSKTVKKIGRSQLSSYHSRYYNTSNVVISYAGNLTHDELLSHVTKMDIPSSKKIKTVNPMPVFSSAKKHESERQYQQSHYLNLIRTEGYASIDRYPLGIINIILGDGLSSRLNQKLREKLGLVYTVYSTLSLLSDAGTLGIYAAAELSKMGKIENMIKNEIQSICSSGFTDREIIKAKEQLKSSTIMALEGLSSRMQSNARMELSTGEYESLSDTITIVDSITKDQIHQVVKKYLAVENNCEVKLLGRKSD